MSDQPQKSDTPRLTIQPITIHPITDHDTAERILAGFARDCTAFASIILAVGGFALVLLAHAAQ